MNNNRQCDARMTGKIFSFRLSLFAVVIAFLLAALFSIMGISIRALAGPINADDHHYYLNDYQDDDWDDDDWDDDSDPDSDQDDDNCLVCSFIGIPILIVGVVFALIMIMLYKQNKWWNSLSAREQNFYFSLGHNRKALYKMYQAGRLPVSPIAPPSPLGTSGSFGSTARASDKKACLSCGQMVDIRYTVCPFCRQYTSPARSSERDSTREPDRFRSQEPEIKAPVIIQNIGEYIAGSKTSISDSVIQRSNIGVPRPPKISELSRAGKNKVLGEYKIILKHAWSDGNISKGEKAILDHIRWRDEINAEDHRRVENEILKEMTGGYDE